MILNKNGQLKGQPSSLQHNYELFKKKKKRLSNTQGFTNCMNFFFFQMKKTLYHPNCLLNKKSQKCETKTFFNYERKLSFTAIKKSIGLFHKRNQIKFHLSIFTNRYHNTFQKKGVVDDKSRWTILRFQRMRWFLWFFRMKF